jgi:HD-like signal output (HDOD) protein
MLFRRENRPEPVDPPLDTGTLARFVPFARVPAENLQRMLGHAQTLRFGPGLIGDRLPEGRRYYLLDGAVQVQTATGSMLMLRAGTDQARYPLPAAGTLVGVLATEPCRFISMPHLRERRRASAVLAQPAMSSEESDALQLLRGYLQSNQCELPTLPDLAIKISHAIDDPETTNQDVARLIQIDPALSARVLSVVNSAAFGAMGKITSIQQAAGRLGRNKVRSLVYSCLLKSIFSIEFPNLKRRMQALWQHSAEVAALAFVLGRATPGIDPEQAMLAGLVHDIGAIAVICAAGQFPVLAERDELLDFAIAELRVELGLRVLARWRLEEELGDMVRDAENWWRTGSAIAETADVVMLAQMHAMIGTPAQRRLPPMDQVPAFAKLAGGELSPRASLNLLELAAAEVREVHALISAD